jgi:hypothetical protein
VKSEAELYSIFFFDIFQQCTVTVAVVAREAAEQG